jgi:alkanesulfonate monooxygenase SsuD/methylene tetrahydromethanopterin reductase-like flavin-dependent oxidoreductase (luciferase family)
VKGALAKSASTRRIFSAKRLPALELHILVGIHASAHAEVDRVLAEGYRGTGKAELLVGSPATIVERLRHYRGLGFEEVMVRHITGDHALMLRSFALIGESVMPAIRNL